MSKNILQYLAFFMLLCMTSCQEDEKNSQPQELQLIHQKIEEISQKEGLEGKAKLVVQIKKDALGNEVVKGLFESYEVISLADAFVYEAPQFFMVKAMRKGEVSLSYHGGEGKEVQQYQLPVSSNNQTEK